MAKNRYYPIDLFSSVPLVYYRSLLDDAPHTYPPNSNNPEWTQSSKGYALMRATGKKAYGYLNHEGFFSRKVTSTDRIRKALDFLKQAASIERANEVAFLKSRLKGLQLDSSLTFNPDDEEFDYIAFIDYLNGSLKGFKEYKEVLLEEKKRIAAYKEGLKSYEEKCAAYIREHNITRKQLSAQERGYLMQESGLTAAVTYTTAGRRNQGAHKGETSTRAAQAIRGLFNNNSYMSSIVNFIIERYGSSLFNFSNGKLELNPTRSAALIKHLANWVYEHGAMEKINEALFNDATTITISDDKQFVLPQSMRDELDAMVNNMLANPYLGETLDSIAQQYNLGHATANKSAINQRSRRFKEKLKKAYEREKANDNVKKNRKGQSVSFDTWLKHQGLTREKIAAIVTAADTISVQIHYESEGDAATVISQNWKMPSSVVGFKNLATDVLGTAGHLIVTIDTNTEAIEKLQSTITEKIHKSQMNMARKLTQNNTNDDFFKNSKIVKAAQEEQTLLIEEELRQISKLQQTSEELLVALRQHTSVKDYATIGSKSKEYSGTSLGSTLSAQIDRIGALMKAAGLESINSDGIWLKTFLINLAPGLLADFSDKRAQLEHYFSTIFMFLMFDDNLAWVESIREGTSRQGGISNLHLYRLNTIVVPQSYILTKLHEALSKIYVEVKSAESNPTKYVHVKIHNKYKTKDSFYTGTIDPSEWYRESAEAEAATKITLSFMGNFINLINELEKTLQL